MILQEYDEQKHIENEKKWSYEEGQERASLLAKYLIQSDRIEDLLRSTTNKEYREQLFKEFGI